MFYHKIYCRKIYWYDNCFRQENDDFTLHALFYAIMKLCIVKRVFHERRKTSLVKRMWSVFLINCVQSYTTLFMWSNDFVLVVITHIVSVYGIPLRDFLENHTHN